ncbi:putative transporter in sor 3'region [Metallosphaera sp. J1]|uniref:DMT family transporter n=1 Tax=Metallosphaera javensis (ex Hofmann et al. 2022) TaxID=99938 RepID=UPI001EDDBDA1|nr:DMT family transporter [Metallosphaera javensis (ex Hofmann et al. 2022)]MCG3108978.1 putative transporter in sor 3'region [Metallosphaera javensis (ex Hofmann et al. 2022)]
MKILKYLIPYIVLGSLQYRFTKDGLAFASPFLFMSLRYFIGGMALLPLARRIVLNKDVIILTLLTTASSGLWAMGLNYVAPSESAVLSYTMPLFSIPIAYLLLSEKPRSFEVAGAMIGFLGVAVYGLSLSGRLSLLGGILTVLNAVFWAAFTVYYRKMRTMDPAVVNTSQMLLGSLVFLALTPLGFRFDPSLSFLGDLLFSALLGGSVLFYLWNVMLRLERVGKVTVMAFSVPIASSLLDEVTGEVQLNHESYAGMLTMLTGILLSRKDDIFSRKRKVEVKSTT